MARPPLSLIVLCIFAAQCGTQSPSTSYNGLALTPQMGWDNWNAFGCAVSEGLLLSTAGRIVELG